MTTGWMQIQDDEVQTGMRVVTNEGYWGTVESVASVGDAYQPTWWNVRYDKDADHDQAGMTVMQNAPRMTRRHLRGDLDPHPGRRSRCVMDLIGKETR